MLRFDVFDVEGSFATSDASRLDVSRQVRQQKRQVALVLAWELGSASLSRFTISDCTTTREQKGRVIDSPWFHQEPKNERCIVKCTYTAVASTGNLVLLELDVVILTSYTCDKS